MIACPNCGEHTLKTLPGNYLVDGRTIRKVELGTALQINIETEICKGCGTKWGYRIKYPPVTHVDVEIIQREDIGKPVITR